MGDNLSCVVCGEPARALCASGQPFCNAHAACGICHVVLSNGELQGALERLGCGDKQLAIKILRNGATLVHELNDYFCSTAERELLLSADDGGIHAHANPFSVLPV